MVPACILGLKKAGQNHPRPSERSRPGHRPGVIRFRLRRRKPKALLKARWQVPAIFHAVVNLEIDGVLKIVFSMWYLGVS